jgi:hypothetical protein
MYKNVLHSGIPDSCIEMFTPLLQTKATTTISAAEPYKALLCCAEGEELFRDHNVARSLFCFGHIKKGKTN